MKRLLNLVLSGDRKIFYFINDKLKNNYFDKIMPKITKLGGAIFAGLFTLALIISRNDFIRLLGIELLIALSVSTIIVHSIKVIASRERPYNMLQKINTFNIILKDYSFPSGHSTAIFTIVTSLSLNIPYLSSSLYPIAALIGVSRIYIGVHYPTDVLIGSILGYTVSTYLHSHLPFI